MNQNSKSVWTIKDWMDYIQTLHHREIEMSLERVQEVMKRMYPNGLECAVITIAGTNGKGSTAELVSSIYREAGYRVGKYTSPHLVSFNERFNVQGMNIADAALLSSLARVEASRKNTPLTYFEFGTLVAIDLFANTNLDVAVFEVGLGGRLDAVKIVEADISVVTNISIDHTSWLGNTINQIAAEKIAIAAPNSKCVLGMTKLPEAITSYCSANNIVTIQAGVDFEACLNHPQKSWSWRSGDFEYQSLALPFSQTGNQINNASVALSVVHNMLEVLPIKLSVLEQIISKGLRRAKLLGRCQLVSLKPKIVLDVSHNEDSVRVLSEFVQGLKCTGRVIAVCGMLADKEIGRALGQLVDVIDEWHFATIYGERGSKAAYVEQQLLDDMERQSDSKAPALNSFLHDNVKDAFLEVKPSLIEHDCLVVFGSFYIVSDIIALEQK